MRAPSDKAIRRMVLAVLLVDVALDRLPAVDAVYFLVGCGFASTFSAARASGLAGGEERGEASEARPADVAVPAPTHELHDR